MLNMIKKLSYVGLIASAVLITGCSTRLGNFTAASTQNVRNLNYSIGDSSKQKVEGNSCIHSVFFLPMGHSDDRLQRAMDDAISNGQKEGLDGDLLVNVRINHNAWSAIIYGQDCVIVEGDLVKINKKT